MSNRKANNSNHWPNDTVCAPGFRAAQARGPAAEPDTLLALPVAPERAADDPAQHPHRTNGALGPAGPAARPVESLNGRVTVGTVTTQRIGFIGQGWIGRNYADCFETRGYDVVRYSLEEPYVGNRQSILGCRIVFIAVPTPTRPTGFDDSLVVSALENVRSGSTAVVKSTILPGTTERLQDLFPDILVMHSPEFLAEKTAAFDAANPSRNIVGIPKDNPEYRTRAAEVLSLLPRAPFELICAAREAELIKYGANAFLYLKVVYANILHDLARCLDCDYTRVSAMVAADKRIGPSHLKIADDGGRGAGGHCFIKDFEAFIGLYEKAANDPEGLLALESWRDKNLQLLRDSGKNIDLLREVYGVRAGRLTRPES